MYPNTYRNLCIWVSAVSMETGLSGLGIMGINAIKYSLYSKSLLDVSPVLVSVNNCSLKFNKNLTIN